MLVVVHEDDAVRVGGDLAEGGIGGGGGSVDVEAEVARVHVGVELMDEAQVGREGVAGKAFKVQRKAVIDGERCEQANQLPAQFRAFAGVGENGAEGGIPGLGVGIEVVEVGKDFGIFPGYLDHVLDPVVLVGVVDGGAIDHGILAMAVAIDGQQRGLRGVDVKPLGEEQINLVDVLFEGGVAGRVVLHIIGGAQTFTGVEGNIRGFAGGLPAGRPGFGAAQQRGAVVEGFVVVLGHGQ